MKKFKPLVFSRVCNPKGDPRRQDSKKWEKSCVPQVIFTRGFTNNWPILISGKTHQEIEDRYPQLLKRTVTERNRLFRAPILDVHTDQMDEPFFELSPNKRSPMPHEALVFIFEEVFGDEVCLRVCEHVVARGGNQLWSLHTKFGELSLEIEDSVDTFRISDQTVVLTIFGNNLESDLEAIQICEKISEKYSSIDISHDVQKATKELAQAKALENANQSRQKPDRPC